MTLMVDIVHLALRLRIICALIIFVISAGFALGAAAFAQTGPYQTSGTSPIGATTECGISDFTTTIDVTDNIIIADLDVGYLASHTWRTDINFTLSSPQGTSAALLAGPFGIGVDNYNIRLDDEAGNQVDQAPHNTSDTIMPVPPYQNTVRPESPLSVFDGENASGLWTLSMCDVFPGADNGLFRQSNLFFTAVPAVLSASKTVNVWDPASLGLYAIPGNDVIYTISAANTGAGYTDDGSLFLVDSIPADMEFYNGDIDDGGPETGPVSFVDSGSGLSFDAATDIGYSNAAAKPTDFSQCTYTPAAGYDPAVKHVCVQPTGQMQPGDPDPGFAINFRCKIK